MADVKNCPLQSNNSEYATVTECTSGCAWYLEEQKECAIVLIAKNLAQPTSHQQS